MCLIKSVFDKCHKKMHHVRANSTMHKFAMQPYSIVGVLFILQNG